MRRTVPSLGRHAGTGREARRDRPGDLTRRLRPNFAIDRRAEFIDTLLVATVFLAILFNMMIGPLTPLTVMAVVCAFAILRWERIWPLLSRTWPLLCLPLLAIVSVLWSAEPAATLRYGTLYLIAVTCGVILGGGLSTDGFLKGSFGAFLFYSVVAILIGRYVPTIEGPAFAGMLGSKNASGDAAGLSLLSSIAIVVWGLPRRKLVWVLAGLVAIPLCTFILWQSKATGALIASVIASFCLVMWSLSARMAAQVRVSLFVIAIVATLGLALTWNRWMPALFDAVLEGSGKDAGLTGRADLWRKADELITIKPWLGNGYNAFWVHNNLDAEYLWRLMGIQSRMGFNFHNTARDILVDLGFVGLCSFLVVGIAYAGNLIVRTMIAPTAMRITACAYLLFFIPKFPFEMIGFGGMHFATIMLFGILASGTQPELSPAAASRGVHAVRPMKRGLRLKTF